MSDLVVIEAAINGTTQKTVNPGVPVTEDEIVADGLACFEAGAAIVHQHITDYNLSGDDAAEVYLGIWRRVLAPADERRGQTPAARAWSASMVCPAIASHLAQCGPASRVSRLIPPEPGSAAILRISGRPKTVSSEANVGWCRR
ncbi:MAG: 3-keto-5-aminohexanoate cleavage enzyme [Mycobacterium sp.]|nr:3-keto-5-aminohexanoate cleavage enzyme [Mycobacterium sp.]